MCGLVTDFRLDGDLSGIRQRFICNLCNGRSMTNVLNHVQTPRHQELKKQSELEKQKSMSESHSNHQGDFMQADENDVGFDKRHIDGGTDDEMMSQEMVESPDRSDSITDDELKDLADVVELFKETYIEGSEISSDLEADLLWEDLEDSKGEEDVGNTSNSKVTPEKENPTAYQYEWHPYASQEVGVG